MIDVMGFYKTYNIIHKTEGSKHCQPGWIQIPCPFCTGNSGWHLGYSQHMGYYNCWRCGKHSELEVIKTLLGLTWGQARDILDTYQTGKARLKQSYKKLQKADECIMPAGCVPLQAIHKKYLRQRRFDPQKLIELWGLQGTGPVGSYKLRIIAPIYVNDVLVSYQGRDITNKAEAKYKACKSEDEVIDHKHCLYGIDRVPGDVVVAVEGTTDVWRLGAGAVGTFGIKFKPAQINELKRFKRVVTLFDSDPQAIEEAEKLGESLASFNTEVEIIEMEGGDPDDLPQEEADELMKELLK